MPLQHFGRQTARRFRTSMLLLQAALLGGFTIMPFLVQHAYAANSITQLTERSAYYSTVTTVVASAKPGATTNITVSFKIPSGSHVTRAALLEFCDNPLGNCTTAYTPTLTGASYGGASGQSGWDDTTTFSYALGNGTAVFNDGAATAGNSFQNLAKFTRAGATTAETTTGSVHTLTLNNIVNNAAANQAYYVRMSLFDNATVPTAFDQAYLDNNEWYNGTVAQSTSRTLIVNARVQEHLDFCVGQTPTDDATSNPATSGGTAKNCTDISGDTVDIGTITPTSVAVSPVPLTPDGGNALNGVAMVASNAANGTVISFFSEQDTDAGTLGHGTLKIPGAPCDTSIATGTGVTTDKCFNNYTNNNTTAIASGTEEFGMIIKQVNTFDVNSVYTGANLVPNANYYQGAGGCTGGSGTSTCNKFAWNDTSTAFNIASSASSAIKVINYEALILGFAATAGVTTPTGQYTVASTYIATSTF